VEEHLFELSSVKGAKQRGLITKDTKGSDIYTLKLRESVVKIFFSSDAILVAALPRWARCG
jgi:hypothetical protein